MNSDTKPITTLSELIDEVTEENKERLLLDLDNLMKLALLARKAGIKPSTVILDPSIADDNKNEFRATIVGFDGKLKLTLDGDELQKFLDGRGV